MTFDEWWKHNGWPEQYAWEKKTYHAIWIAAQEQIREQMRPRAGNAEKCRAEGCSRKTASATGYCWQHAGMAQYKQEATK